MKHIYFVQPQWIYDTAVYLPTAVGMLAANCLASEEFKQHYELDMDFRFERIDPAEMIAGFKDPAIVGFSTYIWSERYCLAVAKLLKAAHPNCLIVFGGPSVAKYPSVNEVFLRANPFVDVCVHGEGEATFLELALAQAKWPNWRAEWSSDIREPQKKSGLAQIEVQTKPPIPGVSYILNGAHYYPVRERERAKDVNVFPSPFLTGVFETVMKKPYRFEALWETDRGCPYACSFCDWGTAINSKVYPFGLDRLEAELDWFISKGIKYIYNADANFGLLPRDDKIVDMLVAKKAKHGIPEKMFTNYPKNSTKKIYTLAKKLSDAGLSKSTTLSMQSHDPATLENIKRDNIKLSSYYELQKLYRESSVPTCTELIMGLPGETHKSFLDGIEKTVESGETAAIFIYHCRVLPNAEMGDPEYRAKFGIVSRPTIIQSNHASLADEAVPGGIPEYEEGIVATASMPIEEWLSCNSVAWFITSFLCMRLGAFPMLWMKKEFGFGVTTFALWMLAEPDAMRDAVRYPLLAREYQRQEKYYLATAKGLPEVPRDGIEDSLPIRWPLEEATFMALSKNMDAFYAEYFDLVRRYLEFRLGREITGEEARLLLEIKDYQRARITRWNGPRYGAAALPFDSNVPEYFDKLLRLDESAKLEQKPTEMTIVNPPVYVDAHDFSKRGIWYARRGGKFLYDVEIK